MDVNDVLSTVRHLVIAVDFDGTIIDKDDWPKAEHLKQDAKEYINKIHDELNCEIIIWTCRDNTWDNDLDSCKEFLLKNDIHYDYINENSYLMQSLWHNNPRKVFADIYIDDKAMFNKPVIWEDLYNYIVLYKEQRKDKFF